MARRKESVTLYLEPAQWAEVRALSARTKVPAAVYVRAALDEWLERRKNAPSPEAPGAAERPGSGSGMYVRRGPEAPPT